MLAIVIGSDWARRWEFPSGREANRDQPKHSADGPEANIVIQIL